MLQIVSGKLFQQAPGQQNKLRGVLHTNLRLTGSDPIVTAAGRLLPTHSIHNTRTLVYELTELIEDSPRAGSVASHGMDPYLNEFAAIVSFGLNVTCTSDPGLTQRLASSQPGPLVHVSPRGLVRRIFDDSVWCSDSDRADLVDLVENLIGLKRKSHQAAMRAIRTYVTALHRLADDLTLAYTLLVAAVESLVLDFDGHIPSWEDYEDGKRRRIDLELTNVDDETAKRIRRVLLEIDHVKASRRFREFALKYVREAYYREDAVGLDSPIGRAELPGALQQAYSLRSGYIHDLRELPPLLPLVGHNEKLRIDGRTLLTIQGMARLARHVIWEFIKRQPKVSTEQYDYSLERVGIVQARIAPRYWIHRAGDLTPQSGRQWLEGFLDQLTECLRQEPGAGITDLTDVLRSIERILPQANRVSRRPLLALYFIYNRLVLTESQMSGLTRVAERYGHELERPSVEALLMHLLLETIPEWTLPKHQSVHDSYFRNQGKKNSLKVSHTLEAGLSLDLAERYRKSGDTENASVLIAHAVDNHPGHEPLLRFQQTFNPQEPIIWRAAVLPAHPEHNEAG